MHTTPSATRLRPPSRRALGLLAAVGLAVSTFSAGSTSAHEGPDDGSEDDGTLSLPTDWSGGLEVSDLESNVISGSPSAKVTKNLDVVGRGVRNVGDATTDVWAHDGYAYTGTFNEPCGGDPEAGIWVWDVHNANKPSFVTVIESPVGSRTNDVKVASMNSGNILVHSNEPCGAGGVGGFEVYNVDDPANPVFLAHVQVDEINPITDALFGGLSDNGVHNLFLFTQGGNDYVAVQSEGAFDGFQIFDLNDPSNPTLVSGWGAEEIYDPGVGDLTDLGNPAEVDRVADAANWLLDGFGASRNRFLHDFTISADGTKAYLAHWDAGLILLDISDVTNPTPVSVALDPAKGSLDGEVNSHSVWPSKDGKIVVEGEEDFSAWEATVPPGNVTFGDGNPIPGVIAATSTGDAFEASQTGNAGSITASSVTVTSGSLAGSVFPANEFSGNNFPLGTGSYSGKFVWIGRACNGDPILNAVEAGDIAVVRRGACTFAEKSVNAYNAGAGAIVVTNNNPVSTPWSGLRIWDYSDPTNPVLASTFNTVCSASTAPSAQCAANGTYSVHNVVVESKGNKV
ncbi:MAG: PA domain-containing protein, partial [Ilumatobacteraceae bacterium]